MIQLIKAFKTIKNNLKLQKYLRQRNSSSYLILLLPIFKILAVDSQT